MVIWCSIYLIQDRIAQCLLEKQREVGGGVCEKRAFYLIFFVYTKKIPSTANRTGEYFKKFKNSLPIIDTDSKQ